MPCSVRCPWSMLLASLVLFPVVAHAELYKWIDERGITNYSNQPPATAHAARKSRVVEDKVSVYTPDRTLTQAVEAARTRAVDDIRTGRRERQIEAEWLARQSLASAQSQYVDPCAGDPGCSGYGMYPYAPLASYGSHRGRLRILPQIALTPGTTAGNVTAGTGYIPGYSAFARTPALQSRPRRVLEGAAAAQPGGRNGRAHGGQRGR